jgi:multidrug efflux pump subunit AcrA (membrane-fusion protein)
VSGFVEEINVDRGSAVKRGQLLARLSAPELATQRSEVESKLTAARSTFERTRAAAETPGAIAKHDLEVQEAAVKADEARVQSLKTLESYLYVRAPFDGIVLADTFQMTEDGGFDDQEAFPANSGRAVRQRGLDIRVIIANPPYSVGQTSGNDRPSMPT